MARLASAVSQIEEMSCSHEVVRAVTPRFLGFEDAGCAAVRRGRRLATDPAIEATGGKTEFGRLQLQRAQFDIRETASPPTRINLSPLSSKKLGRPTSPFASRMPSG